MTVTREDLNPCTVLLNVVCDADEVRGGFEKAFKQIAKKVRLPGFRPGHAPKAMVEGMIQKEELYETALDFIFRATYKSALESNTVEPDPTTRPTLDVKLLDKDTAAAEYSVKVPLPPKITLGEYTGLPLERPGIVVTDEEVERQIDEFRKKRQTRETITDRGVQQGDVAVLNVKIEGEPGDGRNFMTMAGQTFPELDEALMGMRIEEMKNLEVTFPENFQEKDWAGQTHKIQVTVNSLTDVKLPELDDTFAQSLKSENIDDLRGKIKASIERAKFDMLRELVNEQLLERLHERSEVLVSDNMWESLAQRRMQEMAEEQHKEGKTVESYAAEQGMTMDQLTEAWNSNARLHVERALMVREVFVKEAMQLTNKDLELELMAMAQEYNVELDEMFKTLQKNEAIDELHFRGISRKVAAFLEGHADVKEIAAV